MSWYKKAQEDDSLDIGDITREILSKSPDVFTDTHPSTYLKPGKLYAWDLRPGKAPAMMSTMGVYCGSESPDVLLFADPNDTKYKKWFVPTSMVWKFREI
jgi:hypothetical protein